MEKINKTFRKISKNDIKLSSILHQDFRPNKSSDLINTNSRFVNNSHNNSHNCFKKIELLNSKNKLTTNKDLTKYSSCLLKNIFPNDKKKNNIQVIKKIDISTQKNFYPKKTPSTLSQIKSNILKNLVENIPKKNNSEIDYVLESPHRGVEKIQYSTPKPNGNIKLKNIFSPIFINNTYKGYFCKNYEKNNLSVNNTKKLFIDKYMEIKQDKKIDNPLKKLSQLTGISCYKLRQAINYGLNSKIKDRFKLFYKNGQNKNKKAILDNNKYNNNFKNIYSIITLKSKNNRKNKIIEDNTLEKENEGSSEYIIYPKKFKDIKPFMDSFKNDNDFLDI